MKVLFAPRQANLFERFAYPEFEVSEDYQIIDQVLNDEKIIQQLAKDFPDVSTGRNRTPVEQTLRFLVLKHQRGLDYRSLERTLKVNLEDRWFCKITNQTPCFKTIQNQIAQIEEGTVKKINDLVMQEAKARKLTRGRKMRLDSTITEANVRYPTDWGLIADGIRVITRTLFKLKKVPQGYRTFKRKLKQQANLIRTLGRKNKEIREKVLREMVKMGRIVLGKTKHFRKDIIKHYHQILEKVIQQTEQVLEGSNPKERIVSVFETTARAITKGKTDRKWEFGQEVQIQEDEHFITNWEINNQSSDVKFFKKAIDKHKQLFDRPPNALATDRGYWSPENKEYAEECQIKHISLPKKGRLNQEERECQSLAIFKRLQRWRAGGEAKVSLLKRPYKLNKCRYKGQSGMVRWVGAGILACNLMTMARLIPTK